MCQYIFWHGEKKEHCEIFPLIRPLNAPLRSENVGGKNSLRALLDKTKELESRQQSDLETNVFQFTGPGKPLFEQDDLSSSVWRISLG